MKFLNRISFLAIAILLGIVTVSAQIRPPVPRPSQKASVMQTIGTTDVTITYSRPAVKGRTIFADPPAAMAARAKGEATLDNQNDRQKGEPIVPYGHVWRAGANEATLFVVTDDVLINGQPLAAGKYSLHMIPTKKEVTVIFNKDDGQWGSFFYDENKDALRVKSKAEWRKDKQELLNYSFDPVGDNAATVVLRWEKLRVPFTIEVKDVVAATMNHLRGYIAASKPDDPAPYLNAGNYAKSVKLNDDAMKWFDQAMKLNDAQIAAKPTYGNLARRSSIYLGMDKKAEAIAAAEAAVAQGKTEKADTSAMEKRIADLKAAKN